MRILYVLKRFPRLSETFVLHEMLGLEAAGDVVGVDALLAPEVGPRHAALAGLAASVRYLPRRPARLDPTVFAAHVRVARRGPHRWLATAVRVRRGRLRGGWRRFAQAALVADRAQRDHFEQIHAHFATAAAEVAVLAGQLSGLPVTVTAHAKDIHHHDNAPLLPIRLSRTAAVVTVSAANAAHLRSVLTVPVHHVANRTPLPELDEVSGHNPAGAVLCVCRLVAKKGLDVLISAVADLARDHPGLRVEILGDGPERAALEAQANRLGIADRVRFAGAVPADEVTAAYHRAAMVVLPCRIDADGDRDGLPTVLVEAMGYGVPVISTELPGIPELVVHGRSGLLVSHDDPTGLAAAIAKLIENPDLAAEVGREGRLAVEAQHDPTQSTAALRAVLRSVATRGGNAR